MSALAHPGRWPWFGVVAWAAIAAVVALLVVDLSHQSSSTSGGTHGSGVAVTATRSVGAFTGVELAGASVVRIVAGQPRQVVVHADDNLIGRVTTHVRAGQLVIGTSGSFSTSVPMHVDVRTPSLRTLTLSGAGTVTVHGVRGQALNVALPGSGMVSVTGTVRRLGVSISGSGHVDLSQLTARNAAVVVSGSGDALVDVSQRLAALVSGSGSIVYSGNPPVVARRVTGSGSITAR